MYISTWTFVWTLAFGRHERFRSVSRIYALARLDSTRDRPGVTRDTAARTVTVHISPYLCPIISL